MKKVYLSFSSSWRPLAVPLVEKLCVDDIVATVTVPEFFDIPAKAMSALDECDVVVLLIGDDPISSNAMLEIGFAMGRGKPVALIVPPHQASVPYSLKMLPLFIADTDGTWVDELRNFIRSIPSRDESTPPALQRQLLDFTKSESLLSEYSAGEFVKLVAEYFIIAVANAEIQVMEGGDFDLLVRDIDSNFTMAIEIKKILPSSVTGIGGALNLVKVLELGHFDLGLVITTGRFSASARDFARNISPPLKLFTLTELLRIPVESLMLELRAGVSVRAEKEKTDSQGNL